MNLTEAIEILKEILIHNQENFDCSPYKSDEEKFYKRRIKAIDIILNHLVKTN